MTTIMTKTVKGNVVAWGTDGRVYFSRNMFDALPKDMQGKSSSCNTPREFEHLCEQFEGLSKGGWGNEHEQ